MGVMEVAREHYPDPTDASGKFVVVDMAPRYALKSSVTLARIKTHPGLSDMALIRQSRLSVMPVTHAQWNTLLDMGTR